MSHRDEVDEMAHAIVASHSALALPAEGAMVPVPEHDEPAYLAALQAGSQLGFSAPDALCLARAWRAQVQRCGSFDPAAWPADPVDFGMPRGRRAAPFASCPQRLGLYAVLPDAAWIGRLARAGVPTLQLRFKSTDGAAVRNEVRAAVAAVRGTEALLFINDHWQAAIEAGAYGVHLGQDDLARLTEGDRTALRRAGLRLGLSSHGYADMLRAEALGPSYLSLGAGLPAALKAKIARSQAPARLAACVRLMQGGRGIPCVAIGGIDSARLPQVLATGVGSVAVMRAIVAARQPETEAVRWIAKVAAGRGSAAIAGPPSRSSSPAPVAIT